ncbi:MAG: CFI-box-CTERM domain-containing protein [Dehalococcoidia bacterium]
MKKRNRLLLVGMVLVLLLLAFPMPAVAASQSIWTSPDCGQVGARVEVYGYDFTPESNITITWEGVPLATDPEDVVTDDSGYFSAYIVVPDVDYGDYTIRATDGEGLWAECTFEVAPPGIWFYPSQGPVGGRVEVYGYSFTPDSDITITWEGDPIATDPEDVVTDDSGYFSAYIVVPDVDYGDYTIRATDGEGLWAEEIFSVIPPYIEILPWARGPAGSSFEIYGRTFTPESEISITWSGDPIDTDPEVVVTNSYGTFRTDIIVPDVPDGEYTIRATDGEGLWAEEVFTVGPVPTAIWLFPWQGAADSDLTIIGIGFTPESEITVTCDDDPISMEEAWVDDWGILFAEIAVPDVSLGYHTIEVTDEESLSGEALFNVVTRGISVFPGGGSPDDWAFLMGSGFTENSEVTITLDGEPVEAYGETDSTGQLWGEIEVPDIPAGDYTMRATDKEGLWAETAFHVSLNGIAVSPSEGLAGSLVFAYVWDIPYESDITITWAGEFVETPTFLSEVIGLPFGCYAFIVPDAPAGDYSVKAMYGEELWEETTFTVIETGTPPPPHTGCFIATAAYGTPMAHEVQALREFRDDCLLTNPVGQAFVDFYYRVSPPIAEFITDHPSLKPIARTVLVPAVAMSRVIIGATRAGTAVLLGFLVLASVAVAVSVARKRGRCSEYN